MKYAVYTRLYRQDGTAIEVMVMGIESTSAGGAEHRLLDNFQTVTNALAFNMETEMQYAAPYIATSECISYVEFALRVNRREARMQQAIDEEYEEISYTENENRQLKCEIYALERKIKELKSRIEDNNEYISDCNAQIEQFCKLVHMVPKHSVEYTTIGIA